MYFQVQITVKPFSSIEGGTEIKIIGGMPPQNIIKGGKKLPPLKNQKRGKYYILYK